ncbi:iron-sulfur cluster assembly protein, putative [Ichthyophthirius multifiliis]|uniref:Iron-sulfur cluster assembly protein, putative n=1 Tax=Ichthyophthirius multifiliis TaxID=5932 RepID=G0R468_ICHMU|nr:iron-sulfur cluster assembly protein, putative [Ichthyophthirius multifiliis]EGR27739.1 iron-sulfur cluster assembly protein, putative [Ichthyophthirius multifiliis]|eukprot:XP_004025191.1 iron-sulfur cluster assembly protein, putative [Ichthyophthirius multifiliis]
MIPLFIKKSIQLNKNFIYLQNCNFCQDLKKTIQPKQKKAFITLTDRAAEKIKELISKSQDQNYLAVKIGIKKRGCSGLSYTMNYCDNKKENKFDEVIYDKGVTVIIDNKALMALVGTEMDWLEDDLRAEFIFNNPNQKGACGCGESFYI